MIFTRGQELELSNLYNLYSMQQINARTRKYDEIKHNI